MAYNNSIPQASDQLKNSQPQILANFQALSPFGNGFADFTLQTVQPPTLGIATTDTGLYTYNNATTGVNEMYIQKFSNSLPVQVPMPASAMSNAAPAACVNGWAYSPTGLLMKWGQILMSSNGVSNVNYNANSGGPAYTQAFQVIFTPFQSVGAAPTFNCLYAGSLTTTTFKVVAANANANTYINYLVLGV